MDSLHLRSRRRRAQILNDRMLRSVRELLQTKPAECDAQLRKVLDSCERHLGDRHLVTLNTGRALGITQYTLGRYTEAVKTLDAVIVAYDTTQDIHRIGHRIARCYRAKAQLGPEGAEAVREVRTVVDECTADWGGEAHVTLLCRSYLAELLLEVEQYDEAAAIMDELVRIHARLDGPDAKQTECARHVLGTALAHLGEYDRAERELTAAMANPGAGHSCKLVCAQGLAKIAAGRGDRDEAVRRYETAMRGWIDLLGDDHRYVREIRAELTALS